MFEVWLRCSSPTRSLVPIARSIWERFHWFHSAFCTQTFEFCQVVWGEKSRPWSFAWSAMDPVWSPCACSALMQSLIFQHLASICILGGKEQHYTLGNFILSNPMRMPALAVMAIAVSVEILSLRSLESMPFVSHVLYRQTNIHIHSDISQRFTDCMWATKPANFSAKDVHAPDVWDIERSECQALQRLFAVELFGNLQQGIDLSCHGFSDSPLDWSQRSQAQRHSDSQDQV